MWYSGTSATCTSDSPTGFTGLSHTFSPTSTTYYCVRETDSATTNSVVYTGTRQVTVSGNAIAISINNTASTATSAPFQQLLSVSPSSYVNTTNWKNVEFLYPNGTVMRSWLENFTSFGATYWLNISSGIPADTAITIYMATALINTNLFNGNTVGEAPQLSNPYARYDNGAKVFANYWNWAGTSLPSGWTAGTYNGGSVSINNGLRISSPFSVNAYAYVVGGSFPITSTSIIESGEYNIVTYYCSGTYTNASNDDFAGFSTASSGITVKTTGERQFNQYVGVSQFLSDTPNGYSTDSQLWDQGAVASTSASVNNGNFIEGSSHNPLNAYYDDAPMFTSASGYSGTLYPMQGWVTMTGNCPGNTDAISSHWTRIRAYPPGGVMPGVSGAGSMLVRNGAVSQSSSVMGGETIVTTSDTSHRTAAATTTIPVR
jgi:hypothetical protein